MEDRRLDLLTQRAVPTAWGGHRSHDQNLVAKSQAEWIAFWM